MLPIHTLLAAPCLAGVQVNGAGAVYPTISQALSASSSGDTLNVGAGSYTESVVIDRDIALVGPEIGIATWYGASGSEIILLEPTFSLTLQRLDLRGDAADRRVLTAEGDNAIVLDTVDLESDSASDGGVLYASDPASLTLRHSLLKGTSAGDGGAIYADGGAIFPLIVEDSVFEDTLANGVGGAIYSISGELDISRSLFCQSEASGGGAIYSNADAVIRSSRFVETAATSTGGALQIVSGTWTVENNHFLGVTATNTSGVVDIYASSAATVRNNLFADHYGYAIYRHVGVHTTRYNWFEGSSANYSLDATNDLNSPAEPELVSWSADGNCSNDSPWPTPLVSPLLDAGDPSLLDPDGSISDIGAYGGPSADLAFHSDGDADGGLFFRDCDDEDPARSEDLDELCDLIDNDCDDIVDDNPVDMRHYYQDCDGDGQGTLETELIQCAWPNLPACGGHYVCLESDGPTASQDCDDTDDTIYVGADELCDPEDRDCDGDPEAGATNAIVYYPDFDGDGYGGEEEASCDGLPLGAVLVGGDCADLEPNVNPGQLEQCNGVDDDCSGEIDDAGPAVTWHPDFDFDGYGDEALSMSSPCAPADGWIDRGGDCDDTDDQVSPAAAEACNGVDDDCNDLVDDAPPTLWFPDEDGDGYGDDALPQESSCPPELSALEGGDCDDLLAEVHPGAPEICNGLDDDCAQGVDNLQIVSVWYLDSDGDKLGDEAQTMQASCAPGPEWVPAAGDCDDQDAEVGQECRGGCGCQQQGSWAPSLPLIALLLVGQRRARS